MEHRVAPRRTGPASASPPPLPRRRPLRKESLLPIHSAQLLSYLKATNLTVGLLINFNVRYLRDGIKRLAL